MAHSLGVEPAPCNLFENLRDGLIFSKYFTGSRLVAPCFDSVQAAPLPTMLDEEEQEDIRVTPNESTLSHFKQAENTNFVDADIIDALKTLVLATVESFIHNAHLCDSIHFFTGWILRLVALSSRPANQTCPHRDGPTQPHKKDPTITTSHWSRSSYSGLDL
ncbi:hypothetical protein DFJ58DRAFT_743376 [Suillus subalutaceus]|uniref:uncharacterized protein n=1 Tax=Suillus subalutaceus TaxID=48586 RepID=UPI001B873984|nr:uncharacterized protein DFJ58DRAFT_743376 [Suillus subalutaceus]KAG1864947.1 hypothetical protein DFJ58DRAFT_743376 [Suillus subalutaceus]